MRMTTAMVCSALVLVTSECWAQCPDSLLWASPGGTTLLPTDGFIVVKGFGPVGRQIADLARKRPSLRAEGDTVPLVVLSVDEGIAGDSLSVPVTEATLVPVRKLRESTTYRLDLRDLDPRRETTWRRLAWTTSPIASLAAKPQSMGFDPERVGSRTDGPAECSGLLAEVLPARHDFGRFVEPPPHRWAIGFRLLAIIVFHCGVAVAAAAWIAARSRRHSRNEPAS